MASTSAANGSPNTRVASPTNESAFSGHSIHSAVPSARLCPPSSPTHKKVVTAPPWARHEPPSPQASSTFLAVEHSPSVRLDPRRPFDRSGHGLDASDVASSHASTAEPSHWWTFNISYNLPLPLPLRKSSTHEKDRPSTSKANTIKERKSTWLFDRAQDKAAAPNTESSEDENEDEADARPQTLSASSATHGGSQTQTGGRRRGLRMHFTGSSLAPPFAPFTMRQNQTPGWDSPWAPISRPDEAHIRPDGSTGYDNVEQGVLANEEAEKRSARTGRRRKAWKTWLLTSNYVPLIIRLLNITFTTATLAIAITIRSRERENHLTGAIGVSPILAIIFAPLTLVHVMASVYLEYFGKPLGLWSTSGKLLHTVSEMLFISMWSASLSLCFDNYFTSPLRCVPESATFWWNRIERVADIPSSDEGSAVADQICDDQLALICVVFAGVVLYCSNLIISLFRIFEKVKYHGDRSTA